VDELIASFETRLKALLRMTIFLVLLRKFVILRRARSERLEGRKSPAAIC
jgi:hypothetical protein